MKRSTLFAALIATLHALSGHSGAVAQPPPPPPPIPTPPIPKVPDPAKPAEPARKAPTPAPTPASKPADSATDESVPVVPSATSFILGFDHTLLPERYSGRVYLIFATRATREPRLQFGDWFGKVQFIAADVRALTSGQSLSLDGASIGWPVAPSDVPPGEYIVQAVARVNPDSPKPGRGAGDLYSEPVKVRIDPAKATSKVATLRLASAVKPRELRDTDRVKFVEIKSDALSEFAGREVRQKAGVILPKGWTDDHNASHPTLVWVGGFGSDHASALALSGMFDRIPGADRCLVIVPDPSCFRGHSVFADSATNGPRGRALIDELIPHVEQRFHGAKAGTRRFVSGMSSGGWSSLWLQVEYPDAFNGCWSHCPDPVDFRDFQRINLYAPDANMYKDPAGARRPIARRGDTPLLWFDDFVAQETAMGPGGQIHSFEAVFSPRNLAGDPVLLFDRATGKVDPAVARAWEPFDIRLKLEREWSSRGPKLAGKIVVYAGEVDTFLLEGAAKLLKDALAGLNSDAQVVIVPGMAHDIHRPGLDGMFRAIAERTGNPLPAPTPATNP